MKVKVNIPMAVLFIILVLADNMFWLVSSAQARIGQDFAALLIIMFILLIVFIRLRKNKHFSLEKKNEMAFLMVFPLIIAFYSSVVGYFHYGQSFIRDFLAQRYMFAGFLTYFLAVKIIDRDEYYLERLIKLLVLLGAIEVIAYLPQYFLVDKFIYLSCNIVRRLGTPRLYTSSCAIPILIFYCIDALMHKKGNGFRYWLGVIGGLYYSIFVSKTRLAMVAYVIAIFVGYLLWKHGGVKKILMSIPLVIGSMYLLNSELFQFLIGGLHAEDSSAQTRVIGRQLYISKWLENLKTFMFGNGYINSDNARRFSGVFDGIFPVDLGVYAIGYLFGIIGIAWLIILFYKLLKKAWHLAQKGNMFSLMYLIYLLILLPNGTAFIWQIQASVVLSLMVCYIERAEKIPIT